MKIKALEWTKADWWLTRSPAGNRDGYMLISKEGGRFWPLWSDEMVDGELISFATIEEAQAYGQKAHEDFLKEFYLEPDQEVLFTSDMKMLREMAGRTITLTVRVGYPGSRVSDLMFGDQRVQINNSAIANAIVG
jgi:hypothetical protein